MAPCEVCRKPTASKYGVCSAAGPCHRERSRRVAARYRRENHAAVLAAHRRWKEKPGRVCRFAAAGCAEPAVAGQILCSGHVVSEGKRRRYEAETGLVEFLAADQDWLCPECGLTLLDDWDTVEADHIIPYSSGIVIHDYFNRHAIHAICNRRKNARCGVEEYQTALARFLELAA